MQANEGYTYPSFLAISIEYSLLFILTLSLNLLQTSYGALGHEQGVEDCGLLKK